MSSGYQDEMGEETEPDHHKGRSTRIPTWVGASMVQTTSEAQNEKQGGGMVFRGQQSVKEISF